MARIGLYTASAHVDRTNQDSCFAKVATTPLGEVSMAVVCDGVGGFDRGEVPSSSVAARFATWFETDLPEYIALNRTASAVDISGIKREWERLLERCNAALYSRASQDKTRWGTTFTGVLIHHGMYVLAQVGDSRCYLVSPEETRQLTYDQTFAMRETAQGRLSSEEALVHPRRNQLLQAVGSQNGLVPEITVGTFDPGSLFLLCSDGLSRLVSDEELGDMFLPVSLAEDSVVADTCATAFNLARSRGEQDDITVVCLAPDAWAPALSSFGSAEDATSYHEGLNDLDFIEDGMGPTLAKEDASRALETTGHATKSGTEASTEGHLNLDGWDDEETTADSFEPGEA